MFRHKTLSSLISSGETTKQFEPEDGKINKKFALEINLKFITKTRQNLTQTDSFDFKNSPNLIEIDLSMNFIKYLIYWYLECVFQLARFVYFTKNLRTKLRNDSIPAKAKNKWRVKLTWEKKKIVSERAVSEREIEKKERSSSDKRQSIKLKQNLATSASFETVVHNFVFTLNSKLRIGRNKLDFDLTQIFVNFKSQKFKLNSDKATKFRVCRCRVYYIYVYSTPLEVWLLISVLWWCTEQNADLTGKGQSWLSRERSSGFSVFSK